jgi:hypothetical protein
MRLKWVLGIIAALACAVCVRADALTTQVTLGPTYSPTAASVPGVVNTAGGLGSGISYTASTGALGSPVYETGADALGTFKLFSGVSGSFNSNFTIVETFAFQGVVIPPNPGAAFSAQFTKGVVALYAVPALTFNVNSVATWGTGQAGGAAGTFLGSFTLAAVQNVGKGFFGDTAFGGQPTTGQNQGNFFPSSGTQTLGAFIVNNLNVPTTLFGPPQNFTGFQSEISEADSLSPGGAYPGDTNANLDANFSFLAGLAPGQGMTTGQFTALNYTGNVSATGPFTLQELSSTNYPIVAVAGIPEPTSMLLWGLGAVGIGAYMRRRRAKKAAA